MPESKIQATHRLQREGLWDEASAYRDQERQRARAEGKTRREANEIGWQQMLVKYPLTKIKISDDIESIIDEIAIYSFCLKYAPPGPPEPAAGQAGFNEVWWTHNMLELCQWYPSLAEPGQASARQLFTEELGKPPTYRAQRILITSMLDPERFYTLFAQKVFRTWLRMNRNNDHPNAELRRRLVQFELQRLPELKRQFSASTVGGAGERLET